MAAALSAAINEARPQSLSLPRVAEPDKTLRLLATLTQATGLAQRAYSSAISLALAEYGDIDLPDLTPAATAEDQAQLRAVAPLYLAAQLEESQLLPVVETLSALAVSGGISIDLGPAAANIEAFWRQRNDRFQENERRGLFARLFGADDLNGSHAENSRQLSFNQAFENLMIDLCESLYKLDEQTFNDMSITPQAHFRVLMAARNVADNLLERSGGITAFAANEILTTIQSAVQILQQPSVQRAFGARSLWTLVRSFAGRYLQSSSNTTTYVTRGKSGLVILSWLADSLPQLSDGGRLLTLDHPVIGSAAEWLQASLAIREAQTGG